MSGDHGSNLPESLALSDFDIKAPATPNRCTVFGTNALLGHCALSP